MQGGVKAVEDVPLGVDVLHRTQRPFGELRNRVAGVANHVAVRLELNVTLGNELLNLFYKLGESLAEVRDALLLHYLAQAKLGEVSLYL